MHCSLNNDIRDTISGQFCLFELNEIIGNPICELEAINILKSDREAYNRYLQFNEYDRTELLETIMGIRAIPINNDCILKKIFYGTNSTKRLERLLGAIISSPVLIKQILPRSGSYMSSSGSFVLLDTIILDSNNDLINVEVLKLCNDIWEPDKIEPDDYVNTLLGLCNSSRMIHTDGDIGKSLDILLIPKTPDFINTKSEYVRYYHFDFSHNLMEPCDDACTGNRNTNVICIFLDHFTKQSIPHDIVTRLDCWMTFLCCNDFATIKLLSNGSNDIRIMYKELYSLRENSSELVEIFEQLFISRGNRTTSSIVDELNAKIIEKDIRIKDLESELTILKSSLQVGNI